MTPTADDGTVFVGGVDADELAGPWQLVCRALGLRLPSWPAASMFDQIPYEDVLALVLEERWFPKVYEEADKEAHASIGHVPAEKFDERDDISCAFFYRLGLGLGAYLHHAITTLDDFTASPQAEEALAIRIVAQMARRAGDGA